MNKEENKDIGNESPKDSHDVSENKTSMPAPPPPASGLKKVITKGDFRKKEGKAKPSQKSKKSKEEKDLERDLRRKEKDEEREKRREQKRLEKEEERIKRKQLKVSKSQFISNQV